MTFDKDAYRNFSRQQWEQTAAGWHKWMPKLGPQWAETFVEQAFEMANIGNGQNVLDIASGDGYYAIQAAKQVGPSGHVLATDLASNMVAFIKEAIEEHDLSNMQADVMNGEYLRADDNSFDVVMCFLGLMLFAEPEKGVAEAYRVLKSGGRYLVTVVTTPDKSPWLSIPAKVALQHANRPMPPPGTPGIFALGQDGKVEQLMNDAGFIDVKSRKITLPFKLESAAECALCVSEIAGAIKGILAGLDEEKQRAAWDAIAVALKPLEDENGFSSPTEIVMVVGQK